LQREIALKADNGDRIYSYRMNMKLNDGAMETTITEPDEISGIKIISGGRSSKSRSKIRCSKPIFRKYPAHACRRIAYADEGMGKTRLRMR
jgi:hypothetical protein